MEMNLQWVLLATIPFASALIGWATNFVAVKMLLHPLQPKKILWMTFQGLIPKRIDDLADRVAKSIARDFLTKEDVAEMVEKVHLKPFLVSFVKEKWDEKQGDFLDKFPMIKMFLPQEKLDEIRDTIVDSFAEGDEDISLKIAEEISDKVDLEEVIRSNILKFDLAQLDDIINEIAKNEFRYIERLGGVIGFVVGLAQLGIFFLI